MNRISRKWLALLLGLTLAGTVLAGCSSGTAPATSAAPTPPAATTAPAATQPATPVGTAVTGAVTATPATPAATTPAAPTTPATAAQPAQATPAPAPNGSASTAPTPAIAPPAPAVSTPAAQPASPWPMTVKDDAGRSVAIPAQPKRILSLAPSNTEILFALGLGDRVVGVDDYSDFPAAAQSVQKVGGLFNPNVEAMVSLQPDLVLAIGGSEKQWGKLAAQGVPVVVVQPENIAGVLTSIRFVGKLVGATDAAATVTAQMQARIDYIREQVARVHNYSPTVFYEVWNDPLMTVGPGSFMDDMISIAGGSNVFHGASTAWPTVTLEAAVAANPDVIISSSSDWLSDLRARKFAAWNGITAVKKNSVYLVEDNLVSRPGPRITEGLWQVAKAVNPLLFGQ